MSLDYRSDLLRSWLETGRMVFPGPRSFMSNHPFYTVVFLFHCLLFHCSIVFLFHCQYRSTVHLLRGVRSLQTIVEFGIDIWSSPRPWKDSPSSLRVSPPVLPSGSPGPLLSPKSDSEPTFLVLSPTMDQIPFSSPTQSLCSFYRREPFCPCFQPSVSSSFTNVH